MRKIKVTIEFEIDDSKLTATERKVATASGLRDAWEHIQKEMLQHPALTVINLLAAEDVAPSR